MKPFLVKLLRRFTRMPVRPAFAEYATSAAANQLRALMKDRFTVAGLKNVSADDFQKHIQSLPGKRDAEVEGFTDASRQRDFTIQFEWGHNHDFGTFSMQGTMRDRHVNILATLLTDYGLTVADFAGKRVLDIGCWTGGTSLLLAAMGAEVVAIEEVKKYAICVEYLANAFGLTNLTVERHSLYALDMPEFYERFDFVLYSGVLYHVTDPVLSLRIAFNCLRDGGRCMLETYAANGADSYCEYHGAYETYNRETRGQPRWGWNWFLPTPEATKRMMIDVGFRVTKIDLHDENRVLAIGVRDQHVDMLRAGLSKPSVR